MAIAVKSLDRMFNPRTVAVVGDSKARDFMFLKALKDFQGKLYSIQVNADSIKEIEALGITNYRSLLEVPEPLDYVLLSVPRRVAPQIVADCIKKGVGGVALFTSGFAETDTTEGKQAQEELTRMAKQANLNLVGPNCMGIYNPRIGLRFNIEQYIGTDGRVGVVSQSGNHLSDLSVLGVSQGVKLSKGVSFGNAIVLDSPDYLDYFAYDPSVEIIVLYVEGVKDGRRFFKILREVAARKPVLIWKGGQTEDSARAIFSHTANLAESMIIWEAMIKQVGAVRVNNMEETIDTLKAFIYMKRPRGNRMGLIAVSGGQSVVMADAFARAGLQVGRLSAASYVELSTFVPDVGGSFKNPLDVNWHVSWQIDLASYERILNVLDGDSNVDCIAAEVNMDIFVRRARSDATFQEKMLATLGRFRERSSKPFLVIINPGSYETMVPEMRLQLVAQGLAVYSSFTTAASSVKRLVDYWQRREAEDR
ncbi:MAG: CoA-binding protein [Chloroflexota bacterium]